MDLKIFKVKIVMYQKMDGYKNSFRLININPKTRSDIIIFEIKVEFYISLERHCMPKLLSVEVDKVIFKF